MTVQVKPTSYTKVWASTGSKVVPDDFKIGRGWEVEKPPHEVMNWVQNRQDQWIAHANQRGIAQWDASTEYKANVSYVTGAVSGNVYRATVSNVNINPETDTSGSWILAFTSPGFVGSTYLAKSANLADLDSIITSRANLDVYSKAEVYNKTETYSKVETDNKYLSKVDNLADLSSKPTARTNLEVYSKADIDAMFPAGEVVMFAMGTMPAGFIPCDGRSLSRTTYARLFTAFGNQPIYGSVDSNSFNVPDFRGEFLRGWAANRVGVDTGRAMGSWQNHAYESHTHQIWGDARNGLSGGGRLPTTAEEGRETWVYTEPSGGSETRPRNYPVYYGIRF